MEIRIRATAIARVSRRRVVTIMESAWIDSVHFLGIGRCSDHIHRDEFAVVDIVCCHICGNDIGTHHSARTHAECRMIIIDKQSGGNGANHYTHYTEPEYEVGSSHIE